METWPDKRTQYSRVKRWWHLGSKGMNIFSVEKRKDVCRRFIWWYRGIGSRWGAIEVEPTCRVGHTLHKDFAGWIKSLLNNIKGSWRIFLLDPTEYETLSKTSRKHGSINQPTRILEELGILQLKRLRFTAIETRMSIRIIRSRSKRESENQDVSTIHLVSERHDDPCPYIVIKEKSRTMMWIRSNPYSTQTKQKTRFYPMKKTTIHFVHANDDRQEVICKSLNEKSARAMMMLCKNMLMIVQKSCRKTKRWLPRIRRVTFVDVRMVRWV